jgi:23S rRNA (cytosine1962-C5)-methyltransferase
MQNKFDRLNLYYPTNWKEYELLDSGDGEKLEKFGRVTTWRPEPQALWSKALPIKEWERLAHVRFVQKGSHSGTWKKLKDCPDQWPISYSADGLYSLTFNLSLTSFKHVGIFPEQADNWDFIFNQVSELKKHMQPVKVLNLFAYTGGASLAAKAAGADVTHVDSVKQVIGWSRQNMESSNLTDIRWVVEDAFKFVQREVRRGNHYHGVILDPPAYGIGTNGERWKLDEQINALLHEVKQLLAPSHFVVLNMYSLGMSALITDNLMRSIFDSKLSTREVGELYLPSATGQKLPLGILARLTSDYTL